MKLKKLTIPFPKHTFSDLFEEANYKITLKFSFFLSISLIFLYLTQFISYNPNRSNLILIAIVVSLIFYLYIKKTGRYKIPSLIGCYTYGIIIELSLYAIPKNQPIITGLWMLNNIFFTFRCVNKKNGLIITFIHIVSLILYYFFFINYRSEFISQNLVFFDKVAICFNLLFAFIVFLFFIHQTIDTNIKASQKIKLINEEIYNQFKIINSQNEEKTILLKEIHHRVKNNLQIIISLLRLQSYQIDDFKSIQLFNTAINRIYSISSIHEKIYQNDDFKKLNLEEYLYDLTKEIISLHELNSKIRTNFNFEIKYIELDPIVPLALILNELISNSIKHFDFKNKELLIEIEFKKNEKSCLQLCYSDNGTWSSSSENKSLGLELINTLTKQINGKISLQKQPKTQYIFDFENVI